MYFIKIALAMSMATQGVLAAPVAAPVPTFWPIQNLLEWILPVGTPGATAGTAADGSGTSMSPPASTTESVPGQTGPTTSVSVPTPDTSVPGTSSDNAQSSGLSEDPNTTDPTDSSYGTPTGPTKGNGGGYYGQGPDTTLPPTVSGGSNAGNSTTIGVGTPAPDNGADSGNSTLTDSDDTESA